jgi:hypothetical protein
LQKFNSPLQLTLHLVPNDVEGDCVVVRQCRQTSLGDYAP